MASKEPLLIPGPTPHGGSYAKVFERIDGDKLKFEIVEYDIQNRELYRTYGEKTLLEKAKGSL